LREHTLSDDEIFCGGLVLSIDDGRLRIVNANAARKGVKSLECPAMERVETQWKYIVRKDSLRKLLV
jgi:hypothetical protein